MELKEFTFENPEEQYPEWRFENYYVLYKPDSAYNTEGYVIHPEEAASWVINKNEIDRYIEMLTWMKEHQTSLAEPSTEDRTDPPLDDPNPVEEEG